MAGLVPAIATNNTFLSEIDATNPAITWGSTALNGAKKSPGEPGLEVVFPSFQVDITSSSGRNASSSPP